MNKKRNIIIIILIIVIAFLIAILFLKMKESQKVGKVVENIGDEDKLKTQINTIGLSEHEKEEAINELKNDVKNATNKIVLDINGEKVTEKEIAIIDFQLNNKQLNKERKDPTKETIKEYVICQKAKENGIVLSEKEQKDIKDRIVQYMEKDNNQTKELAKACNMNEKELLEFLATREKRLQIVSKWNMNVIELIDEGKTENNKDEQFKKKYNEYKTSKELSERYKLLNELCELYENYLIEQATIKYID